jgi:hypothetical protein
MKTDSKFNDFLNVTAEKAATGKLTVLEAKDRIWRMNAYLSKIETPTTTKKVKLVENDVSRKLRRQLQDLADTQKLVVADVGRSGKAKRKDVEGSAVFRDAVLAIAGGHDAFGAIMLDRLKNLDLEFFQTMKTVVKVGQQFRLARKLAGIGFNALHLEVFSDHVFHTLAAAIEIRKAGKVMPDSFTMKQIVTSWVGDTAYEDCNFKDWRSVWKAAEIKPAHPKNGTSKARVDFAYSVFCKGKDFPSALPKNKGFTSTAKRKNTSNGL